MMSNYENDAHDNVNDEDCTSVGDDKSVNNTKSSGENVATNTIGTKESKDVARLRLVVLFVIFISAVAVAVSVYIIIRRQEMNKFDEAVISETEKIVNSVVDGMRHLIGSLDMFSTLVISHARNTNSKWPFVTVPDFPNHASKLLSNGVGNTLIMSVIVTPENRLQWEQYSVENSNIVQSALRIMETDKNYHGDINWNYTISPVIVNTSMGSPIIPYDTT
jgi:hypothetical protein